MKKIFILIYSVCFLIVFCGFMEENYNMNLSFYFSGDEFIITSNYIINENTLNNPNIIKIESISSNQDKTNNIYSVKLLEPNKLKVLELIEEFDDNSLIVNAHPDFYLDIIPYGIPNDFYHNFDSDLGQIDLKQWAAEKINLYDAWTIFDHSNPTKIVKVGILDSGINLDPICIEDYVINALEHEDLEGVVNWNQSTNYSTVNDKFDDLENHGTYIAGIIAATRDNYVGIAGVSNKVELYSLKQSNGNSVFSDYTISNSVAAFNYASEIGIEIMNCSFAFTISEITNSEVLLGNYESVEYAINTLEMAINNYNGLVICGAGNSNLNIEIDKVYPASLDCDNIITVGAMNINNGRWNEYSIEGGYPIYLGSNYGSQSVDLFAPGDDIISTKYDKNTHKSGYELINGTSFAAPFVTGVAALIMSLYPDMSMLEVKNTILFNVIEDENFTNLSLYGGYLNAYGSLMYPYYHQYYYDYYNVNYHYSICNTCGYSTLEEHDWVTIKTRAVPSYKECSKCFARQSS